MTRTRGNLLRQIATRGVVAVLPVAMASAYASGLFVQPPRLAALKFEPVAEITVAPTTVGVATSPLYGQPKAAIEKQLDDMLAIGVTNIRVFVPWGLIEQTDNSYNWQSIDDIMSAAAARNMGVLAEVNATPAWAAANPNQLALPGSQLPNTGKFTDFMSDFVARYKTTVSAYEVWNEPNYIGFLNPMSPEAYTDMLKAVYPVIKNLDPTATVIAGGLGAAQDDIFGRTMSPVTFLQRMLAAGAADYFDALSMHPYSEEQKYSASCPTCAPWIQTPRQQLEAMMGMLTGKQVWITEYGLPTTPGGAFTQADQAAWIKDLLDTWQSYSNLKNIDLGPIFLYTGRDTSSSGTDPEAFRGLWDANGNPKDAVAMLKAWIAAHLGPQTPQQPAANPLSQFFAALQQIAQSFSQAISSFFNPGMFIQSVVNAISNLFGFLRPAAPAAAVAAVAAASAEPVTMTAAKVASAAATEPAADASTVVASDSKTVAIEVAAVDESATPAATAVEPAVAAEPVAVTAPVSEPVATETPAAQPKSVDVEKSTTTDEAVTTPVKQVSESSGASESTSTTSPASSSTTSPASTSTTSPASTSTTSPASTTTTSPGSSSTKTSSGTTTSSATKSTGAETTSATKAADQNESPKASSASAASSSSSSSSSSGSSSSSSGGSAD